MAPPRSHPAGLRLRRPRRHRPGRRADLGPEVTASGLAPNTVHKAYQVLSKAMAAAVDAGLLAITPCRNVRLPKVEHREMRFLSPTEIATLAAVVAPRYRALVLVGGYGGLRIGELAGLRRGGSTSCAPGSTWPRSVSRSGASSSPAGPRPGPGARQVPLPRPVAEELAVHLERFVGPEPDAFLFAGPDGGALRGRQWRARHWAPAVAEAALAPLRPHDLRHTAVALWITQGASPKQIATRAGHVRLRRPRPQRPSLPRPRANGHRAPRSRLCRAPGAALGRRPGSVAVSDGDDPVPYGLVLDLDEAWPVLAAL